MSNEFVMVPRCLLSEVISNLGEWSEGLDTQDQVDFVGEQLDRLTSVMSASAEPRAMADRIKSAACSKCASHPCACAELSAPSSHPINMKTMMQAYEQVDHKALLHGTSNWCASMATALRSVIHSEPSAPIYPDERAAFEAAYAAEFSEVRGTPYTAADVASMRNGNWYGDRPFLNGQWAGWQARSALERKPS